MTGQGLAVDPAMFGADALVRYLDLADLCHAKKRKDAVRVVKHRSNVSTNGTPIQYTPIFTVTPLSLYEQLIGELTKGLLEKTQNKP